MGNMFSTRWLGVRTRLDTGSRPIIDIAHLRRIGALTPNAEVLLTWTDTRGVLLGTIQTCMHHDSQSMTLAVGDLTERFRLVTDPCNFGGSRFYVICPGCDHRRRVLYGVGTLFRCRGCHDLAYRSTREEPADRARRRLARLYTRLGAVPDDDTGIPPKPVGMYRSTYAALVRELRQVYADQAEALNMYANVRE